MSKKCKYRLVVVQNGRYGVVLMNDEKEVLGEFETYAQAQAASESKFRMLELTQDQSDRLEGTPWDFINTVSSGEYAVFSDHYFIEEV